MAGNSFGTQFRFTTFGESHGSQIGCIVDGVPAGLSLSEADIQPDLDRRKPGTSKYVTQRREGDEVSIVSGVFEGQTTGTPIGLIIHNGDQRSKDYGEIKDQFRPGHADFTYWQKYGVRDYRGGGRSSARETAMRVAAGAIAKRILADICPQPVTVRGAMVAMGGLGIDRAKWQWDTAASNAFFCPDAQAAEVWAMELDRLRKDGNSAGGVIEVVADGIPAGLGAPVYSKLDSDLAAALMSINAAKGVEIGDGFAAAALNGVGNADEMGVDNHGHPTFDSNHAGGILGGISTGQPVVTRLAIKPTSSILTSRASINRFGEPVSVVTKGRHDPCVAIRGVPVAEAMVAIVLADHLLQARAEGVPLTPRPWDQRED